MRSDISIVDFAICELRRQGSFNHACDYSLKKKGFCASKDCGKNSQAELVFDRAEQVSTVVPYFRWPRTTLKLCYCRSMRPTSRLMQHGARITLFTRVNCSLCGNAKSVLSNLEKKRSFEYNQIDVMASDQMHWKDLYEFDTPVVTCVIFCYLDGSNFYDLRFMSNEFSIHTRSRTLRLKLGS